ncbi:SusD/RagB family nutrient-binding outer membrane lipoprotein [Fodinibius sediminis]|uniref:Susd and RagB outer membrane lipoprotein n=1 Tax=Fodinibius sediminis TaxID=1214077 RepID=A0A521DDV4_9BACT|nr:SusD/RagB family nutrient-binding outer membrane lipoprotein [Fodinibius sediminis]SMO69907.1 Susd and RagB outer membrane lipoprotein [Fodinibius sediminis]
MNSLKKNILKMTSTGLLVILLMAGCTDHFDELNTPDDQLVASNLESAQLGQAFAQAQFYGLYGSPGPFQLMQSLHADIYAQYFATTAPNFDSDQNVMIRSWQNGAWNGFYGAAAPQLDFVENFSEENGMTLENAVAKVMRVQLYHRITDYWGPIIYSEFGNGETKVPYDSQEDVYKDFFVTLDEAVAVLKNNAGGNAFGSNDQIYEGSVDQWLRFANSLRLRLAMRVKYVEPELAKTEAEKAVSDGVMMDNSHNAKLLTTQNSRNPYTTITDWGEFRMSAAMESALEGYEDPRQAKYFQPAVNGDQDGDGNPYEGFRNGLPKTRKESGVEDEGLNDRYSDMGIDWQNDSKGGSNPPIEIMNAAEVYFLRAEGALEGWNMGGTAEALYEEGIRMSMMESTTATSAEIEAYIESGNTPKSPQDIWDSPALTDIPVAFESAGSKERKLEQIITQKWLALYPNSMEAWAEYRRTGYPALYDRINSLNPAIPVGDDVQRIPFASGEYSDNAESVQNAIQLLTSPADEATTKLWWDAK